MELLGGGVIIVLEVSSEDAVVAVVKWHIVENGW